MNTMDTSGGVNGWKSGLIDMHSECIDGGTPAMDVVPHCIKHITTSSMAICVGHAGD